MNAKLLGAFECAKTAPTGGLEGARQPREVGVGVGEDCGEVAPAAFSLADRGEGTAALLPTKMLERTISGRQPRDEMRSTDLKQA